MSDNSTRVISRTILGIVFFAVGYYVGLVLSWGDARAAVVCGAIGGIVGVVLGLVVPPVTATRRPRVESAIFLLIAALGLALLLPFLPAKIRDYFPLQGMAHVIASVPDSAYYIIFYTWLAVLVIKEFTIKSASIKWRINALACAVVTGLYIILTVLRSKSEPAW